MSDDVTTEPTDTDAGTGASTGTSADAEEAEAHRRRTIIRLLVGFGIGIPVLVELATFLGLIEQSLLGGDDGASGDGTGGEGGTSDGGEPGATTTGETGVGVGDELLPETPQRETLTVASFRAGDDRWVLTLAVEVENTGSEPYTVQFASLVTQEGRRVEGSHRPVTVPSGETGQVTGTWQLQPGTRPDRVVVRTTVGDADATAHEVDLGRIPLEGTRP